MLPPVNCMGMKGTLKAGSAPAISTLTRAGFTSSSSATTIASPVYTPWPISALPMMTVTVSSGATRTKALGCRVLPVAAALPNLFSAKRMPT